MHNRNSLPTIFKVMVLFRAITLYVPYVAYNSNLIINGFVVGVLWLYLLSILTSNLFKYIALVLPFSLFMIIDYCYSLIGGESQPVYLFAYGLAQEIMWPLILFAIYKYQDIGFAKLLLGAIFLCFFVTSITTYIGCGIFPGASRELAAIYTDKDLISLSLYQNMNIGGFEFIYSLVLLIPLLVLIIRKPQNSFIYRYLSIAVLVWLFFVVIRSEYSFAILCSFLALLSFLVYERVKTTKIILLLVTALLIVSVRDYIGDILVQASSFFDSNVVSNRIEDLGHVIQGNFATSESADIETRQDLYSTGWKAFLSSPIWGTGEVKGGHSFVLNYMGKYGLIGMALVLFLYKKIYDFSIKTYKNTTLYNFLVVIFLFQILMSFFNPKILYPIFTFILPLFSYVYSTNSFEKRGLIGKDLKLLNYGKY